MATSVSLLNANLVHDAPPGSLLARLDMDLAHYSKPRNQNCALCYIDLNGSVLRIANAGGIPPYVRRASDQAERTTIGSYPLTATASSPSSTSGAGAVLGWSRW